MSLSRFELSIAQAWQRQAWWLWLLLPLSWLYWVIISIRKLCYKTQIIPAYRAPIAVMVVGNITVGGSGKTPLIIELVKHLLAKGVRVGVISRGYGGDESLMPCVVTRHSHPKQVGDEPCLIVRETGVPMSVCPNRQHAIEQLLQVHPDLELIIADDGLQHYKLARDIEWIVVDATRGFGNRQLLPTGFLREPMSRLQDATVIYHQLYQESDGHFSDNLSDSLSRDSNYVSTPNRTSQVSQINQTSQLRVNQQINRLSTANEDVITHAGSAQLTMALRPAALESLQGDNTLTLTFSANRDNHQRTTKSLCPDTNRKVYALSGIGYPQRFFTTLEALGFTVIERPMPDHHKFTVDDLKTLTDHPIIITSKDAVKINPLIQQNPQLADLDIWVLPVRAVLSESCYDTLMAQLLELNLIKT